MTAASNPAAELTGAEAKALRQAFERDKWAGEWNSLPTAVDRLLADRAARLAADRAATDEGLRARVEALADEWLNVRPSLSPEACRTSLLAALDAAPAPTDSSDEWVREHPAGEEVARDLLSRAAATAAEEPRTEAQIKAEALREAADDAAREAAYGAGWWSEWLRDRADCVELCSMGPTCPGGMLAGLDGSGCWRTEDRTHGSNHAPLPDGARLAPGFCAGCDAEADRLSRADEEAGS